MPINPEIPLKVQTPTIQPPDPLATYSQAMQLRGFETYADLFRQHTQVDPGTGKVKSNPDAIKRGLIEAGYPDLAQNYESERLTLREKLGEMEAADRKREVDKMGLLAQLIGPIIHRWIPIPKPFLWAVVYSNPAERAMRWLDTRDPAAFDGLARNLWEGVFPSSIPTAVKPLIEAYANRNIFTGRRLVPPHMKYVDPTYQMHHYTSEWAKLTARALNRAGIKVSPIILDNTLYGYTGGLGRTVTRGVQMLAGAEDEPSPTMADLPLLRAFAVRHPSAGTESVHKFYERLEELETKRGTTKFARENGVTLGQGEAITGPEMAELKRLRALNKHMSAFRKKIRAVRKSSLSPEAKRQQIDQLQTQIVKLARRAALGGRR